MQYSFVLNSKNNAELLFFFIIIIINFFFFFIMKKQFKGHIMGREERNKLNLRKELYLSFHIVKMLIMEQVIFFIFKCFEGYSSG